MCVPDIGPFLWFVVHLGYVAWFKPSGLRIVSRPWLFYLAPTGCCSVGGIWCDVNVPLSFISLSIGGKIYDSHVLVANTGDEGTAKSCGPCARALWSNVGSIGIASSSGSVESQTGQAKVHIPATGIFALLLWEHTQWLYSRSASRLLWRRPRRTDTWTSQPEARPFDRLAGWYSGWRTTFSTGTFWLAGPRCIL